MQQEIWQQTDVLKINLLENLLYYIFFRFCTIIVLLKCNWRITYEYVSG